MVGFSLDTQINEESSLKVIEVTSAGVEPLLNANCSTPSGKLNTLIVVPLVDVVANKSPLLFNAIAAIGSVCPVIALPNGS